MAEYYAGRGTTALGIIGTVLGSLAVAGNGGLGVLGGNGGAPHCADGMPVNRYELTQEQRIGALEAKNALLEANTYNDAKLLEVYKYVDGELKDIRATMCENEKLQAVINAKCESGFAVLNSQVMSLTNTINSLTKTIIPNTSICPGWGNVTVTPATTTA